MRRRVRLTGRRQLPRSSVDVKIHENGGRKLVSMTIAGPASFKEMPESARVKLRLFENKFSETLEFGTIGEMKTVVEITNGAFAVPSCQLRVVASEGDRRGLILGSTSPWNLRTGGDSESGKASEGILLFQPYNIAPRTWKLDIREDDFPLVYVDRSIPDARTWVRNDPVFVSCVLPAIVREIFESILAPDARPDKTWEKDWLDWAETLMPGKAVPWLDGIKQKREWVDDLLDSFCDRHGTLNLLVDRLRQEEA